jgi:ABC-type amino acid transport substrate-binding protein
MTLKEQEDKAKQHYEAELAKTHNLIDTLEEARSFIARHTEPWYYSGNQLLGQIDSVIAAEWQKEYYQYTVGARANGVRNMYTFEQYQAEARKYKPE